MKNRCTLLTLLVFSNFCFGQCPIITKQPISQIDCEGNSIRMIVETDANTIQWERKRPSDTNFSSISGAKSTNYQIYPSGGTNAPDGTIYRAKLTTGACTKYTEEASISLNTITNITGTSICERSDGTLQANIPTNSQSRIKHFQWTTSINGGPFQDIADGIEFTGTNQSNLIIKNASLQNQSQKFKVRIDFEVSPDNDNDGSTNNTNQASTCPRTSSEVSLTIKTSPTPIHSIESYNTCLGTSTSISSSGCSPYATLWYDSNNKKVGEGARPTISFNDSGVQILKASCLKSGCESILSSGVVITVNEIPEKVTNNGTPEKILEGGSIIFKASGGTNNMWYLNESDTKYISSASTITLKNVVSDGTHPFYISRWVSQKVNGCEGPKTEIKVMVEQSSTPNPIPNPEPVPNPNPTPNPPIPNPEPINPDTTNANIPQPNPTPITPPEPEPTPAPEPVIQYFDLQIIKNCQKEIYQIKSTNCLSNVDYFEAENFDFLGSSNQDKEFELDARWFRKIIAKCNMPYYANNYQEFQDIKNPEITTWTNDKKNYCPYDSLEIHSRTNFAANFLYWEKNGHIFSEKNELKIEADSSQFDAVYIHNDCIHRAAAQAITIRPKPKKPIITYIKKSFCPGEKIEVTSLEPAYKYEWSNEISKEKQIIKNSINLNLKVQNEYQCFSEVSDPVQFIKLPKGEKPILHTTKNQFCDGDTSKIVSNLGDQTIWSTGIQAKEIFTSNSSEFYAFTKSVEGCNSDTSEIIRVIKRPLPITPRIERPFNRVLKGIKNLDDILEWEVGNKIIEVANDELRITQPIELQIKSFNNYKINGMNELTCKSEAYKIKIEDIDPYKEMVIYPNPGINFEININTPFDFENGKLKLIDLNGHIMKEEQIQNKQNPIKRRFSGINPGIYLLQIESENWIGQKRVFLLE